MSARTKLNSIYIGASALIAGFLGLMTKSIAVFIICLGVLAGLLFHDGSIRPGRTRRK